MTCFVVTVFETVASDEPAGAHSDGFVAPPLDPRLNIFVSEVSCPGLTGAHLELFRLVRVYDARRRLLLFLLAA